MDLKPDELLIFSDLHAHPFSYKATQEVYGGGYHNSRLVDAVRVLEEIELYAVQHRIANILFGGDLFHKRGSLPTAAVQLVFSALRRIASHGIKLWMIPGNHDYADAVGNIHALRVLPYVHDNIYVEDIPSTHVIGTFSVSMLPYRPSKTKLIEDIAILDKTSVDARHPHLLLAHLGIQGAKVGSDYVLVSPHDIDLGDVSFARFDACFFGHYHEHQKVFRNGWFIGATHQHNWGDAGSTRGFLHVKQAGDGVTFSQVEIESTPKFLRVIDVGGTIGGRDIDFVKVHVPIDTSKENVLSRTRATHVEVVHEEPEDHVPEIPAGIFTPSSMVEAWVKEHKGEDHLVELGKQLLREAAEDSL